MRGKLITFEGCDGVGKSTQIRCLKEHLENRGVKVLLLREPGGNNISEKIRNIILDANNAEMCDKCEALLYFAARAQLIEEVIAPAILRGETVICDRYVDSSLAYQGFARGLGVDFIDSLIQLTCKDYMPDATVFLDLRPEIAFVRKGGACQDDRIEREKLEFHNRVYEGFHKAMELYRDRFIPIIPLENKWETCKLIISALTNKGII